MKILALLLIAASAWGQSVLFNGNSPVSASDPIGTITGAGNGLTISTGTTFTSSVTINNILAASTVTVTGNGSACFTAGGLNVDCNLNQEYFGTSANISTVSNSGAFTLASGAALTVSGANGNIISASSITTTSGLFGQTATITGALTAASGDITTVNSSMTFLTGSGNAIKVIATAASAVPILLTTTTSPSGSVGGLLIEGSSGGDVTGDTQGDFVLYSNNRSIVFSANNGSSINMKVTSTGISIGTMTFGSATAAPNNFALCLANGAFGHCTTVVSVSGGCTCVAP